MPDLDDLREGSVFATDRPNTQAGLIAGEKGSSGQDWGMRNRLSRVFSASDGKTVMLAFDHGYFQGPTSGLERIDLDIVPLLPMADAIMLTRGILRTTIPANVQGGIVLRASGGPSILKDLSDEELAVSIEDAVRSMSRLWLCRCSSGGNTRPSLCEIDDVGRSRSGRRHSDPRCHRRRQRHGP